MNINNKRAARMACGAGWALAIALFSVCPAKAATLCVQSAEGAGAPLPGDVFELVVTPAAGERIATIAMSAFDTHSVKFFVRPDGTVRALVGLPFDRKGGSYPLQAKVVVRKGTLQATEVLKTTLRAGARVFPTQHITMKSSTARTMNKIGALRAEKAHMQQQMKNSGAQPLWRGSWLVPTPGRSTSSYGRRRYVNGKWWGQHNGADIRAGTGSPVRAANSGKVVLSEHLPTLRGNCIVIDHGCNVFSVYMHMSKLLVAVGDVVNRGQQIGKVGATGFVTGPHLHWEVRIGWEPVDPNRVVRYGLHF